MFTLRRSGATSRARLLAGGLTVVLASIVLAAATSTRPSRAAGEHGGLVRKASATRYAPGQLLVKFDDGTRSATARTVIKRAAGRAAGAVTNVGGIGVRVVDVAPSSSADVLAELRDSAAVEYAERDVVVQAQWVVPNDSLWSREWGLRQLEAPAAWRLARPSKGVVVAVLDTGLDSGHPDLRGAAVDGYDALEGKPGAVDEDGHGTAAAGVLAARANNRIGGAGICWDCKVMPVKVLGRDGLGTTSSLAAGIVWAADHGAKVISMSLGAPATTETLSEAVRYAAAKGVVLVAAAGNSATSEPYYPAAYPEVIGVGASSRSGSLYGWSNFGPWVEVAAPGCNLAPKLGGGYAEFCGTSSATPLVAGVAGLALSAAPDATGARIERAIADSALRMTGYVAHGRVNARAVVAALAPKPAAKPSKARSGVMLSPVPAAPASERTRGLALPPRAEPVVSERTFAAAAEVTADRSLASALVAEVNRVRRAHGLRALRVGLALRRAGEGHARNLALTGSFTHDWSAKPFGTWILRYYRPNPARRWTAGENLVWNEGGLTAKQAVDSWLASPPHRAVLLSRAWTEVGIGVIVARRAGGVFGGRDVVIAAGEFGSR